MGRFSFTEGHGLSLRFVLEHLWTIRKIGSSQSELASCDGEIQFSYANWRHLPMTAWSPPADTIYTILYHVAILKKR